MHEPLVVAWLLEEELDYGCEDLQLGLRISALKIIHVEGVGLPE